MHSKNQSAPVRYIPFKKFHIAPLTDITPEAIKSGAAHACDRYRDKEELKPTTAQNFISRVLGFKGGFGGFLQEHATKLKEFMESHRLRSRRDLISARDPGYAIVSLKPRQLSDRLFAIDQPQPARIFTGYDVDWFELNNRFFGNNPWMRHSSYDRGCLPFATVMEESAKAETKSPGAGRQVLEAAITACDFSIRSGVSNCIGDQLLWGHGGGDDELRFVPCIYRDKNCSPEGFHREVERARDVARLFRHWIKPLDRGWVDVIAYSRSLVFLRGRDGEYDFLFPGFRDEPFDHNPFQPHLRNGDVPKSNDTYHFKRWLYYEFPGWLEAEEHRSEIRFYSGDHSANEYPRAEEVLKQHLTLTGAYHPPKKSAAGADGFHATSVAGTMLYVSNLISIHEFREFLSQNPQYAEYSRKPARVDRWETVNCDSDESFPASVTWHDANAYAAWISRERRLPVRLLRSEEYQEIATPIVQPDPEITQEDFRSMERERLCRFSHPDGTSINGHPPYLPEGEFQNLRFCYIPKMMKWRRSPSGLAFLRSYHFGEWLNEKAAAINAGSLSSLCYLGASPATARFSATSTGKYKSKKIGFRLCYLAESPNRVQATA